MSGYYVFLMKVTHLDRHIPKDSSDSRSTICYNSWYLESLAFNLSSGSVITFNSFIINFSPEDILFELIGSQNQDAILAPEVGSISHDDCFAGRNNFDWEFVIFQLFPDPVWAFLMISCELFYSSAFKYKSTPDCFPESIICVLRTEILFAN